MFFNIMYFNAAIWRQAVVVRLRESIDVLEGQTDGLIALNKDRSVAKEDGGLNVCLLAVLMISFI